MDKELVRIIKRARENTILEIQIKALREADRLAESSSQEDVYASYGLRSFAMQLQELMEDKEGLV